MQNIERRNSVAGRKNADSASSNVFIREGELLAKTITNEDEKIKAHRLRYRIFCEELKWVPKNQDLQEKDAYDESAVSFGVFDKHGDLKSYIRLVTSDNCFMLEKEFPFLLGNSRLRKEQDTVEASRLCVAPEARTDIFSGNFGFHTCTMLLYKAFYHWCLLNRKQYVYMVVEQKILRLLCMSGFPWRMIGEPKTMSDGVVAVAAIQDLREFETQNTAKRVKQTAWFSQRQSNLPTWQVPRREIYSRRQA